jgi:hypothetical protein
MGRYDTIKILKNEENKRVYGSVIIPEVPESIDDIYIIAKESDRLDLLAYKYYKDATLWYIIAEANNIKGTFNIEPGTQIRIPINISTFLLNYQTLNS